MKLRPFSRASLTTGIFGLGLGLVSAADIDVLATQTVTAQGIPGVLAQDTVWTADNVYILTDRIYVPNGRTLTIEPGTKIYSTAETRGTASPEDDAVGALIVARGGRLIADGNAAQPIVFDALETLEAERGMDLSFDSDSVVGPRPGIDTSGLWGGVVVLGNAYVLRTNDSGVNLGDDVIEGFTPESATDSDTDGFSDILEYGFDSQFARDDDDDSGILRYLSIRHGGFTFGPDNEINGLTLGGVGRGTTIEFVEVIANDDDGVEFFGGTVNTNNLAVAFCADDSFDIDQGHSGTHQFWFAVQGPGGDNNGEWDGIDGSVKSFSAITNSGVVPSAPQIYNVTFIGGGTNISDDRAPSGRDHGIFVDDSFNGALFDSIVTDSPGFLTNFSSDAAGTRNGTRYGLTITNNLIGDFGSLDDYDAPAIQDNPDTAEDESAPAMPESRPDNASRAVNNAPSGFYFSTIGGVRNGNTEPAVDAQFTSFTRDDSGDLTLIDPRPAAGSVALGITPSAGAPSAVNYRGAFGDSNWLSGWTGLQEFGLFGTSGNDEDSDSDGVSDATENFIGTDPQTPDSQEEIDAAIRAFVVSRENIATAAAEASLLELGAIRANIRAEDDSAFIEFQLQESDDLGVNDPFEAVETFEVDLEDGKQFFRFVQP